MSGGPLLPRVGGTGTLRRLLWAAGLVWTAAVVGNALWNAWEAREAALGLAREALQASFEKDVLYRRWAARHGGVYVPATEQTPPNPYLRQVPERDLVTPSGRALTLVNPAYMTRQVYELEGSRRAIRGRLTSLSPLRPENAPDLWEAESLRAFERGELERSAVTDAGGEPVLRLMRPFFTEEACLRCHGQQGYRVGEVRGGISLSTPLGPFLAAVQEQWVLGALGHGALWLLGLGGLAFLTRSLGAARRRERERTEELRATLLSIGDGVIATDLAGQVTTINPAAEALTGWPAAEAVGRPLDEVFRIVHAETRAPLESPARQVLRRGAAIGLASPTALIARNGTERPIGDSGAPILGPDGTPGGVVLVFRDQSAEREADRAVRQSEERFRLLFEHLFEGLALHEILCDPGGRPVDYRFLAVNPAFERLTGLTAARVLGKTAREVLPGLEARWVEAYGRVALTGEPAQFEEYAGDLDRHYRVLAYCPQRGQFAVVFEDVTDRRRAELERAVTIDLLALLNRAEDLPALAEGAVSLLRGWSGCEAVGLRFRAGDDYPYLAATGFSADFLEAEQRLLGRDAGGELRGDGDGAPAPKCRCGQVVTGRFDPGQPGFTPAGTFWTNALGAAPAPPGARCCREGYESMALVPLRFGTEPLGLLQFGDRRAGRFTADRVAVLERLAAGLAVGLAQRQSAAQARNILRAVPVGTGLVVDQVFREVNDAVTEITGYPREELLGRSARILYTSEEEYEAVGREAHAPRAAGPCTVEAWWRRKDGQLRRVRVQCAPLHESDPSRGLIFAAEDVTDRRRAEEREQELRDQLYQAHKMEAVGQLAGGIAHDFNNQLQVIVGYAEDALGRNPADGEVAEALREIQKAGAHSADLTRQLLAFARRQAAAPRALDLSEAVADSLKMLRRLVGGGVDLVWKPSAAPVPVFLDPSQLQQVLANLVVNARDATGGVGAIAIETANLALDEGSCAPHRGAAPGAFAVLAVTDDGCGMDRETMEHAFEPFFTTKGPGQGTGLGLATVYGIVAQSGGFVDVASEPGRGTAFRIHFPRYQPREAPEPGPPGPTGGAGTVLLVEDEETGRR